MSDQQQIKLLDKGVEFWNKWRRENDKARIELFGARLSKTSLRDANLSGADLSKASFRDADLMGADLSKANLHGADLSGACFIGADLMNANLCGADLDGANLNGARLIEARLTGAILTEANLRKAQLKGADLKKADLREACLIGANLNGADLKRADLRRAQLRRANLSGADLSRADLREVQLREADLSGADLSGAYLMGADLSSADLSGANLSGAYLMGAMFIMTNINRAKFINCNVYGLSVWDLKGIPEKQANLIITPIGEAEITVDDLEVAQFIYLLLKNEKLKNIIDTVTSKAVLILGRFTEERKAVLEAIREELRKQNFTPILFDFDKPSSKDVTGTVETLARMARFIIADLTDPSSIPHELAMVLPNLRTTPVLPIRLKGSGGYSMFEDFQRDLPHRVLKTYEYQDSESLIAILPQVIAPANEKAEALRSRL